MEEILNAFLNRSRISRRNAIAITVGGVAVLAVAAGGYTLLIRQQDPQQQDTGTPKSEAPSPGATPAPTGEKRKVVIALGGDVVSFSPLVVTMITDNGMAIRDIYSTPFTIAGMGSESNVSPNAALSFEPTDGKDFTKMRMVLRKGITFHDGTEFNAESFVHSVDLYNKAPSTEVRYTVIKQMDVIDSHTIDATYESNSITNQLEMITNYFFVFMHPKQEHDQLNEDPIGLGPFKKKSFIPGTELVLERVKDWWGDKLPDSEKGPFLKARGNADEVSFVTIKEVSAAVVALKNGDVDAVAALNLDSIPVVESLPNARVVNSGSAGWYHFHINSLIKPLDDVRVRQAINFATDKVALLKVYGPLGIPLDTLIPEGKLGYDPTIKNYPFDQARAKELLEEAGLKDGFDVKLVGIQTALDPSRMDATIAFSAMLGEVGINAPPDREEVPIWIRSVLNPTQTRIGMWPFRRTFTFRTPDEAITLFEKTVMPPPEGQLAVKEYESIVPLVRKVGATADPAERDKIYREIQKNVMALATDVFYAFSVTHKGVSNRIDFPQWPAEHFIYPYTISLK